MYVYLITRYVLQNDIITNMIKSMAEDVAWFKLA